MRYRLMASYLGASYQAAVGPTDRDVTLFAAPPPPEEHGFSPAPGGIWRKYVRADELDALWESRPIGSYHGEPCLVLDDLGDRLHIVYLGMDERRAGQLGYWQVDRGVFEVVVARHEVTDLAEERHEFPIALLLSALPRALSAGGASAMGNGALPAGQPAAWNGPPMPGSYQMPAPQQAPAGPRQLAASGLQQPPGGAGPQPVTSAYQVQAGPAQSASQPSGGLAGMPSAVPGVPGSPGAAPGSPGRPPHGPGQMSLPTDRLPVAQLPGGMQPASQQQGFGAAPGPAQQSQQGQQGLAQLAQPPLAQPPLAQPQPPAAVAAWHGSPPGDGNGTWYYQPADIDPPPNGLTANGTLASGTVQNGMQGYAPPGQGLGYQQAPSPQQAQPQAAAAQPGWMRAVQQPQPQLSPFAPQPPAQLSVTTEQHQLAATPAAQAAAPLSAPPVAAPPVAAPGGGTGPLDLITTGPLAPAPPAEQSGPADQAAPPVDQADQAPPSEQASVAGPAAGGALSKITGAVRGRRAARKPRLAMSAIFADLVDLAHIPRSAYAVDDEVTGAMCLFKTDGGYEVFSCAEDARHEVRFFEEEESAYFYLFGVLAAEALRNGRLTPRRG